VAAEKAFSEWVARVSEVLEVVGFWMILLMRFTVCLVTLRGVVLNFNTGLGKLGLERWKVNVYRFKYIFRSSVGSKA